MSTEHFFPLDHGCRPTIAIEHHELHEGNFYTFHYENLNVASGNTSIIHIHTGEKAMHIAFDWQSIVGTLFIKMYENPTLATAGTVINISARNRERVVVPDATAFLNPTVTTVGTALIGTRTMLNISTTQSKMDNDRRGVERIFKPNTDYIVSLLTGAASMSYTVDGMFYEEPAYAE